MSEYNLEIGETEIQDFSYDEELAKIQSWHSQDNKNFYFGYKSISGLPSGLFKIVLNETTGFGLSKINYTKDEIYYLPSLPHKEIVGDVNNFLEKRDKFLQYNLVPKRGIILHGTPGSGKTSLIYLLVEEFKNKNGIAIYFNDPQTWVDVAQIVRKLEKDRPILCIIEDLDLVIEKFGEQIFLNFLDGVNQVDNVVYIATTNNIKEIPDRIKNRPSRFDRTYEIKIPSKKDREMYLNNKITGTDLEKYDLEKMVTDTDKFSLAQLKELFIALYILEHDYADTIKRLKSTNINDQASMGFV